MYFSTLTFCFWNNCTFIRSWKNSRGRSHEYFIHVFLNGYRLYYYSTGAKPGNWHWYNRLNCNGRSISLLGHHWYLPGSVIGVSSNCFPCNFHRCTFTMGPWWKPWLSPSPFLTVLQQAERETTHFASLPTCSPLLHPWGGSLVPHGSIVLRKGLRIQLD